MLNYLETIKIALIFFPIIAFVITIPYILIQYHKYGSVYFYRTTIIYSFVLYLLIAYFLVILPLPEKSAVALLDTPRIQLKPFMFIIDIFEKSPFAINNFSTYIATLKSQEFLQAFFNILLCVPFGVYLHYYFQISLKKTIKYTFLLSLFFELTQLTGLYFIYPRSYRLFDIDDLFLNTMGGIIGYFVGSICMKFLPNRNEIDRRALTLGTKVGFFKRITAFLLDLILVSLIGSISLYFINTVFQSKIIERISIVLIGIIYYVVLPLNNNYKTIAQSFLNLQMSCINKKENPTWYQILLYQWYFYFFNFGVFVILKIIFNYMKTIEIITLQSYIFLTTTLIIMYLIYLIIVIFRKASGKKSLHEKLSNITLISTISISKNSI